MIQRTRSMLNIMAVTFVVFSFLNFVFSQSVAMAHPDEEKEGHLFPHEVGKVNISGGITSILQGTSGIPDNGDVTDFTYTLDLNFEAAVSKSGKVVIALEAGNGNGVNVTGVDNQGNDIEPFLSIPNYDAFITEVAGIAAISVSQAYFEETVFNGLLGIHFGKLDVHSLYDENAYANDETDQFISGIFSRYPGSIFPELDNYYAPGVALTFNPSDILEIRLIGANGVNSGFENIFENAYSVGHITIKPGLLGREGNYRFHIIYDARNFTDSGNSETTENTAFGLSFDQEVSDGIGLFARYAIQDDDIEENLVKSAISGGLSLSGNLWNRPDDVLGAAYGLLLVNDKAPDIAAFSKSGDEGHLEIYYKLGFSEHFTLTPDLQVLTNAGGNGDNDTITIYGVRAQMNF